MNHDVGAVALHFQIPGKFVSATPYGTGHINDTYAVTFLQGDSCQRAILQRINHHIFKNPLALMDNIHRVTTHLSSKTPDTPQARRTVLRLIPTHLGNSWHQDESGNYWRAYEFVPNARSYDSVDSPNQAFQAAKAFGDFQKLLADLPEPRLNDTIPDFHHTPKRFQTLENSITVDIANRAYLAQPEIAFALQRKAITGILLGACLPERVTHNDTKLSNVLIDDQTGEGICVIDLDTVMPGLAPYDFGDMVRTTTSPAREDEQDLSKVTMQFPMFEALLRGYLASAGDFLTETEKQFLPFSGKLITFEIGIRFLTDYLSGDTYYKTHRPGHNLDRCRTQFKLMESLEQQEKQMNKLLSLI